MSSESRILILHADDHDRLAELRAHLAPLGRLARLELVEAESWRDLDEAGLATALEGVRGLVVCLSSRSLALTPVLEDRLRPRLLPGRVELVLLRPCAHRLVPWIVEQGLTPRDGRLLHELDRDQLDPELCALTYRLAEGLSAPEPEAAAVVETVEVAIEAPAEVHETETDEVRVEADEDQSPVAEAIEESVVTSEAPAPESEVVSEDPGEAETTPTTAAEAVVEPDLPTVAAVAETDGTAEDETCREFEVSATAILPAGQDAGDEAIAALVELALVLGAGREELGDEAGARLVYRHAAGRLVDLLEPSGPGRHKVSRYSRVSRLALKQALKEVADGGEAASILRGALQKTLEKAPQTQS
ncbi:MAG: hypothetical protein H6807_09345 [Planctomycetes bacterium]|nr:hypothetical protein [Planctomycetota bacterium]